MQTSKIYFFREMFTKYKTLEDIYEPGWRMWDLRTVEGQMSFKICYGELVEEVTELYEYVMTGRLKKEYLPGIMDEVVDILNFSTQMAIRTGFTSNIIKADIGNFPSTIPLIHKDHHSIGFQLMNCIYRFGMVCNLLKNRPWKRSQFPLDRYEFEKRFSVAYNYLIFTIAGFNIEEKLLEKAILDKHKKIIFRQKSGY